MNYRIIPTKVFEKEFKKLDAHMRKRIAKKLNEVTLNPYRYKHLRNELNGSCRLRFHKLRVLFSYDELKREIYLERIVYKHDY